MITLLQEYGLVNPSEFCSDKNHALTENNVVSLKPGKYKHACPSCKQETVFVRTMPVVIL